MKITAITPILLALPYEHGAPKPPMSSGGIRATQDALLVRVDTEEGLTGWGEAFGFATVPVTIPAIEKVIAPLAIGADATDIEGLTTAIRRRCQNMMHGGPARFALSALDIALWDIRGKAEGLPVCKLLGADAPARVPAYASLFRLPGPADVGRICEEAAARGYKRIKLHEKTVEAGAAARAAVGPEVALMMDTNCAFDIDGAIELARGLQPHDFTWLEEPLFPPDDYEALAWLRREGGVPLAIGENLGNPNDIRALAAEAAVDYVQPSVVKIGGITDMMRAIDIARGAGLEVAPHSPFVGPGLAAAIHIVATLGGDTACEHRYCELGASPMGELFTAVDGTLRVPDGPGLGIAIDEDVIRRYRVD